MNHLKIAARLIEAAIEDASELAVEIENAVRGIFPDSYIYARFDRSIHAVITIRFALGKNASEWINGIIHNDPCHSIFFVYGMDASGAIAGPLELTSSDMGTKIIVKSTDPMYAFSKLKVPFRKTVGDSDAILLGVTKHFTKLKNTLQANRDKLAETHLELIGDKF